MLAQLEPRRRKAERQKLCVDCHEMTPVSDLHPDYDDEGRVRGLICGGCY